MHAQQLVKHQKLKTKDKNERKEELLCEDDYSHVFCFQDHIWISGISLATQNISDPKPLFNLQVWSFINASNQKKKNTHKKINLEISTNQRIR